MAYDPYGIVVEDSVAVGTPKMSKKCFQATRFWTRFCYFLDQDFLDFEAEFARFWSVLEG